MPDEQRSRNVRAAWWLFAAWLVVQLTGTSLPGSALPRETYGLDDVVHFGMYFTMAILLCRASYRAGLKPPKLWWLLPAMSAFGALDELHQLFIPGRDCDPVDWAADTVGAAVGVWAAIRILKTKWAAWYA